MMRTNLTAWTDPSGAYPAFVSINRDEHGNLVVSARAAPSDGLPGDLVEITIPAADRDEFLGELRSFR